MEKGELQTLSPMLVEIVRRPAKEGAKPYGMAFRIVRCGVVLVQWDQFQLPYGVSGRNPEVR